MTHTPEDAETAPVPMTRREARRLREAEEAAQRAQTGMIPTGVVPAEEAQEPASAPEPADEPEPEPQPEPEPEPEPEPQPEPAVPPRPVREPAQATAPVRIPETVPAPAQAPAPALAGPQHPQAQVPSRSAEEPAGFVRPPQNGPAKGFRGLVYRLTGGAVNLGQSEQERQEEALEQQITRRLEGTWNTAVLSLKGGIGKTSTTVGVGLVLAELRPEPPCAIDANPDAGDLVERALGEGAYESERHRSITSLLRDFHSVHSRSELARYLHQAGSLHLLAGEQDPELSDSLTAEDYRKVHGLVSRHFNVTLTDCGTGVSRPAMRGILRDADNIVVVAGYAVSGAKRARDTLRWLAAHGYGRLAQQAIVVVTDKDDVSSRVDRDAIKATLAGMCRAFVAVPYDRSLADGDLVSLEALRPDTRRAYREIAAAIVSGYRR